MYLTERDIYKMGRQRGYNFGVNSIQDVTYESLQHDGIVVEDEDQLEGLQYESAYEWEEMDRQNSPFEFTAYELNNHKELDTGDAWAIFESGLDTGVEIAFYLKHRARRKPVK